jgi:hypothetical protein
LYWIEEGSLERPDLVDETAGNEPDPSYHAIVLIRMEILSVFAAADCPEQSAQVISQTANGSGAVAATRPVTTVTGKIASHHRTVNGGYMC